MSTHIHIGQLPSRTTSVTSGSEDDELHEPGVTVSLAGQSPHYSTIQPQSNSGSSSHPDEFVHLTYPNELPEAPGHREVHPSDSASRLDRRDRPEHIRTDSHRREVLQHREVPLAHPPADPRHTSRPRHLHETSPIDDTDSTEAFLADTEYVHQMPRQTLYHSPNGYTQSSSSGSFVYPPVHPPSNQLMHYGHPAQQGTAHGPYGHHPHHHHHQYTPAPAPAPMNYPTSQPGHLPMGYGPPAHVPTHYPSPYGPPQVYHAPAHQGYYPPGYAPPYQHGYPQPHGYPAHAVPPLPAFMDAWRVSPHPANASAVSSSSSDKPAIDQEELIKQMKALMTQSNAEREAKEKERQACIRTAEDQAHAMRKADKERQAEEALIRAEALRAAKEQAETAARLHADRAADEARIRREATEAAEKAIAAAAAAAAEQAAREAKIRKEAAEAALEAAAKEAKAKAEQQEREAKIAADARDAAKSEAEKKAADEAKTAEEAAAKAKDEADKKVKEAEEAAAKAKAEAEVAQAKADAATPAEKKAPVRFKDAIGRNYNFPWERCHKWRDMEGLIIQAFQHIEDLGDHVINRRYDLIGPDKEIIMPEYWDVTIQPDMHITMMLWPLPEKPPEIPLAPPIDGVLDLDDLLGTKKKPKKKATGGGFTNWMFGGPPPKSRKAAKKP